MTEGVDGSELRPIIAGLTEGVILVEMDGRIAWANAAALAMHGVVDLAEHGETTSAYRQRFRLCHRNNRPPGPYPLDRLVAGETFQDVGVEMARDERRDLDVVLSYATTWPRSATSSAPTGGHK